MASFTVVNIYRFSAAAYLTPWVLTLERLGLGPVLVHQLGHPLRSALHQNSEGLAFLIFCNSWSFSTSSSVSSSRHALICAHR